MQLDEWNSALLDDVRARARPGQRLYLFVDRDLLGRLSRLGPEAAVADFCRAFRAATGTRPFQDAAEAAVFWKRQGFPGDPPFVAHLAMTVLAVTEEPLGSSHGVYRRQNELLGLPAEAVAPPGYADYVPLLWETWNAWLDGPGKSLGRPSARTHHSWTRQGWARSQGLIRHQDRLRIERFFEDVGAAQGSTPSVSQLKLWLSYRGAAGRDLLDRLDDEAALEVVQDILEDEAARWRREGPRARHGGRSRGLLHYDDWTATFCGAIEVDPEWHGMSLCLGAEDYCPDEFDDYLLVSPSASEGELLSHGVDHALTDTIVVRFGGDNVYVMRDEPRVNGRLQCRAIDTAANYHVLAHATLVPDLVDALRATGIDQNPCPSTAGGWSWLENVRLDRDSELIRLLGLAALAPPTMGQARLEGGLRVATSCYLVGGEPDLLLAGDASEPASLDGAPLRPPDGQRRISVAHAYPGPGAHEITHGQARLSFRTAAYLQEAAVSGDIYRPLRPGVDSCRFEDPVRGPRVGPSLSGATLVGVDAPEMLIIRRVGAADCLVLTDAGDLLEIWPTVPAWLRRIGLEPDAIDVQEAVRAVTPPAAFLVVRSRHGGAKRGIAVPPGSPRADGRSPSRPRPDLVGEFVSSRWRWVGPPDDERARQVLGLAMTGRAPRKADAPPATTRPTYRHDIQAGRLPANPYDDVLTWLSEQEHARTTTTRFGEVWSWLCRHHGRPELASQWRRAISTLAALGHIERDYLRHQVAVAPAALVALPNAAGLSLLCGARPVRLLERMDDPDDDDNEVASAASCWAIHYRTPTDLGGQPIGPCAVFVEWDPAERETVRTGLNRLGVVLHGCTATRLLEMQPSLRSALRDGQDLQMSPGREPWTWDRAAGGTWEWVRRRSDTAPGLYRYQLARGNVFAWREAADTPLVVVEPAIGQWLARAANGQTSVLCHHFLGRVLLVPASASLPGLLGRALTLRTGLPAYPVSLPQARGGTGTNYVAFENVDAAVAEQVAGLLAQELRTEYGTLRMDR